MIQSLKSKKIRFIFGHNKRLKASIDCSNFITNEFHKDPSGRWFDHKSNSSGLVCFYSVCGRFVFLFPAILTDWATSSQKKYECCLDIWEGRYVYGSEDPLKQECMTWQFSAEAKWKTKKKIGIERPYIFRLNRVIELLEIVDMKANQARLWWWETNTQRNSRNFWQELPAIRRHFSRGSRTGKFSMTILLMEITPKKGWNCTRWLSKPLLWSVNMTMKMVTLHLKSVESASVQNITE